MSHSVAQPKGIIIKQSKFKLQTSSKIRNYSLQNNSQVMIKVLMNFPVHTKTVKVSKFFQCEGWFQQDTISVTKNVVFTWMESRQKDFYWLIK